MRRRWPWLVLGGLIFAALVTFAVPYLKGRTERKPVSLILLEKQGVLQIEWSRTPEVTSVGSSGTLVIVDGGSTENIALGSKDLDTGRMAYQRKTGDIEVRLSVRLADGTAVQEASRFLGRPPFTDPSELSASDARRRQMESEVTRLRSENATQSERIQQLERTLRVLQNRLGVK